MTRRLWVGFLSLLCVGISFVGVQAQNECPESRLVIGHLGQVTPGSSNNVRSDPSTSADLLGQIQGGERFRVWSVGTCAEGYLWVRVLYGETNNQVGWTVEAQGDTYFVDPVPLPAGALDLRASSVAWSPDGDTIALSSDEGVFLLDAQNPDGWPRRFDTEGVTDLLFSPADPAVLATAISYGVVRVWNIHTHQTLLEDIQGTPGGVSLDGNVTGSMSFSPDGSRFFVLEKNGARIYDTTTWAPIGDRLIPFDLEEPFSETNLPVFSAAMSPDMQTLAVFTGSYPSELVLTDLSTGAQTTLEYSVQPNRTPWTLVFSPDSSMLAVSDNQGHVDRWVLATGEHATFSVPFESDYYLISRLVFSPDSTRIAIGEGASWMENSQGIVRLLDTRTLTEIGQTRPENTYEVSGLVFGPDGTQIVATFDRAFVMLFDANNLQ